MHINYPSPRGKNRNSSSARSVLQFFAGRFAISSANIFGECMSGMTIVINDKNMIDWMEENQWKSFNTPHNNNYDILFNIVIIKLYNYDNFFSLSSFFQPIAHFFWQMLKLLIFRLCTAMKHFAKSVVTIGRRLCRNHAGNIIGWQSSICIINSNIHY